MKEVIRFQKGSRPEQGFRRIKRALFLQGDAHFHQIVRRIALEFRPLLRCRADLSYAGFRISRQAGENAGNHSVFRYIGLGDRDGSQQFFGLSRVARARTRQRMVGTDQRNVRGVFRENVPPGEAFLRSKAPMNQAGGLLRCRGVGFQQYRLFPGFQGPLIFLLLGQGFSQP
ncbi:MAG: hypothetical protein BWX80_02080 [Candidatus Hydrogenedentes bacterium ADurb.Bin101]|nr:MAG: hypothetical protein BWX80_02080 [Candidatus Hydrogenedentes bacterium ADurb.Bin101]